MSNNTTTPPETPPDDKKVPATTEDKLRELLDKYETLSKEHVALRQELDTQRINEALAIAGRMLGVPESVVVHDLPRYCQDFTMKEGKAVLRADETQDCHKVLRQLQAERPHWKPTSLGGGHDSYQPQRTDSPHCDGEWFTN